MTRKDAIRKIDYGLEMETTPPVPDQMAITGVGQLTIVSSEALKMARAALAEQEERSEGCPWCLYLEPLCRDGGGDIIAIEADGEGYTLEGDTWSFNIKFCPVCGKKLEVDA